ncbi:MAG: hypothetical protein CMJ50_10315 [Planctomycetaceae bacterium]|nr:hypothetical protein [Planctomycetaceae bacterium]
MVDITLNDNASPVIDATPDNTDLLRRIQREMLRLASSGPTKAELLQGLAEWMSAFAQPLEVFYCERDEQDQLADAIQLDHTAADDHDDRFYQQLTSACHTACRTGELDVRRWATPPRMIVAAPIPLRGSDPEAIGVVFSENNSTPHDMMLVQMVVSHIMLWHVMTGGRELDSNARDSAALVELLDQVTPATSLRQACYSLVGELKEYLKCKRVAVGLRPGGKGRCRLAAISGVTRFDKQSQTVRAFESAMDEAVLHDAVTRWPSINDAYRHPALAHRRLCALEDTQAAVSVPLRNNDGNAVGALIVLADVAESLTAAERFLQTAESSLATSLAVVQRLEGGWLAQLARTAARIWQTWKGKVALAAITFVVAVMLIPLPYRISSDCQIEPVTRRYVVAPFEGTLEKSLVKPGDVVRAGDMLARMDGREIRWQRASVVADLNQAIKKRDVAQASHSYAEQQIAKLESERLELELQLLDHRAENLEIKSPIAGIVASGDLERAEGAPLTIGQTLFEIAPLEKMIVEVALPDDEVSHVDIGQTVNVRLDAYPGQTWQVVVTRVQPRSEIRDEDNVFIVEAELDNTDSHLRPGMKGRAKVKTLRRPLGWILFHKPWEYLTKKLLW